MIRTTNQKTESVPKELPPGWKWDDLAKEKLKLGYRAIRPIEGERCLQTLCFPTEQEAISSAHEIEKARQEGLVGLTGKGLVATNGTNGAERACRVCGCTDMDCRQCVEKTGEPCHWVEEDLCSACVPADAVAERLHKEAVARWRRERPASADGADVNGYHPQMLRMIPINNIEPSPTNPRKHFDQAKLRELADSIIEHGLVEPILVRPVKKSYLLDDCFQLVAGERRWRAAKIAGLTVIEAKVRDLDDKAVLEIQFIENLQRADLSPIEEAEGYRRLLDEHGYAADSLAGKLGKSKSYIYGRLKLCNLPAAAMDALAKGDLPATVGELIGRLPSMEMRQRFWDDWFEDYPHEDFEMPSFRDVKDCIERNYMRELKSAPWNKKDATLVREAGACATCPKMTGNNRAEFPESRADMCTKPPCYDLKVEASKKRKLEAAATDGVRVLTEAESKKYFGYGWLTGDAKREYVDLSEECYESLTNEKKDDEDAEAPTYAQILGDSVKPEAVGMDSAGRLHHLVSRKAAAAALAEKGIKLPAPAPGSDSRKAEADRKKKQKIREAALREAQVLAAGWFAQAYFNGRDTDGLLRLIALNCTVRHPDSIKDVLKRREVKVEGWDYQPALKKYIEGRSGDEVIGFLAELGVSAALGGWAQHGYDRTKCAILEYAGINLKEIEKRVAAEQREADKAKAAKKKPKAKARAASGR